MSKNKNKNGGKADKRLRAQLEILKAQLKSRGEMKHIATNVNLSIAKPSAQDNTNTRLNVKQIRKDLYSTAIFSFIAVAAILVLKLTESKWIPFLNF